MEVSMSYHYGMKPGQKRLPDAVVLKNLDMAIQKLQRARDEYKETALPSSGVQFRVSQAQHLLDNVESTFKH